jgi:ABC-type branched-subunit amino acid transport system substrate-binding protein
MKQILGLGAALMLALPLSLQAADKILIGQSAPLTGSNAEIGKDIRDGALAYFKRVNESGGVNGKQIELISIDDKNDRKTAGRNAVQLVNDANVVALFGFASTTLSLDAMPIVREKHVPFFAPFTGADAIHKQGPYVFVMRASYEDEMGKILEHWEGLGADRVTVLHYDDEIGNQNYATVERIMAKAGKKAVSVKIERNKPVTAADVQRIIAADPQVLIVTTLYGPTANLIKMLHAANHPYNITALSFVGPSQLANAAGPDAAGISISGVVPPPGKTMLPIVRECGDAMKKAGVPELNYTNLESCIAAKVLVEAIRRAGRDVTRETLYRGFQSLGTYDTGGYVVHFDANQRHGSNYVELAVIAKNGQFKF